jgi:manganese-dependent inorganic pyrophosphatase
MSFPTATAIVESDRKEFSEGGRRVSLSQIEKLSLEFFAEGRAELERQIEIEREGCFDLVALFVTDIQSHDSLLLAGGVVSRKKQLFPAVCRAIATVAEV